MKRGLYEKVAARAAGCCESCLGVFGAHWPLTPEADHFWTRAKSEEESTVWLIHALCHADKHAGRPNAEHHIRRFIEFQKRHGYDTAEALRELSWREAKKKAGAVRA